MSATDQEGPNASSPSAVQPSRRAEEAAKSMGESIQSAPSPGRGGQADGTGESESQQKQQLQEQQSGGVDAARKQGASEVLAKNKNESPRFVFEATPVEAEFLEDLKVEDDALEGFVAEYRKLQGSLTTAMKGEKRLVTHCKDKAKQLEQARQKEKESLDITGKYTKQLRDLRSSIEGMRKKIIELKGRKEDNILAVEGSKKNLKDYEQKLKDQRLSLEKKQKERIASLEATLSEHRKVADSDNAVLTSLMQQNLLVHEKKNKLFEEKVELEREINVLEEEMAEVEQHVKRETERKLSLTIAMSDIEVLIQQRKDLIANHEEEIKRITEVIGLERKRVQHLASAFDDLEKDSTSLDARVKECKAETKLSAKECKKQEDELKTIVEERDFLRKKADQVSREAKVLDKMIEKTQQESAKIEILVNKGEKRKSDTEQDIKSLREQLKTMDKRRSELKSTADKYENERKWLKIEKQNKGDKLKKKEIAERIMQVQLKSIRNEKTSMEKEIEDFILTKNRLEQEIWGLKMESSKRELQKAKAGEKVQEWSNIITETTLKIQDSEARLKNIKMRLNQIKGERVLFTEQLGTQKGDMVELKLKFHDLTIRIKQTKGEIQDQDISILREHMNMKHTKERCKTLGDQIKRFTKLVKDRRATIEEQAAKIVKISKIIETAEDQLHEQKKQYDSILGEQKILNQQLTVKNDELAKLHSRLKVQHSVLKKGEDAYNDLMKQIVTLRHTRDGISIELPKYEKEIEDFKDLKQKIGQTQREIIQEKLRIKALFEEMNKAVNIHRWRILRDTDTEAYVKIEQVRRLQQQIMRKATQADKKEAMIREREKLYVELRRVLARQPGEKALEQLKVYEVSLKEKRSKLKSLNSELKMYQARVYECKYDIEKITKDLKVLKQEYFISKFKGNKVKLL
uniref:Cilia- and flagella-associated protein 58 central coiled coil domain-containing protein n=1 Tax=Lotharella globosa TaxID=91324 RepID=A0A7S3Z1R3_9EUKA